MYVCISSWPSGYAHHVEFVVPFDMFLRKSALSCNAAPHILSSSPAEALEV